MSSRTRCFPRRRAGFAVLVTLGTLAAVALLLLGLARLTLADTEAGRSEREQLLARQHARFALEVALSRLQEHAGPDRRVTASAASWPGVHPTRAAYVGVWSTGTEDGPAVRAWLASGADADPAIDLSAEIPSERRVWMVPASPTSSGVAAELRPVTVPDAAGAAMQLTGTFAWWAREEAARAPVAAPFREGEWARLWDPPPTWAGRLSQLGPQGAAAVHADGEPWFDLRDPANRGIADADSLLASAQLSFLHAQSGRRVRDGTPGDGMASWTANSWGVLADSAAGGLRCDLSLRPEYLGPDFVAWANWPAYMEDPAAPVAGGPHPAYGPDPLRRRYWISPGDAARPRIAPVLSYFSMLFGIRKQHAGAPFLLSLRWAAALWNPYTSALIPEPLRLEIHGLPERVVLQEGSTGAGLREFSLRGLYGAPLVVDLPWTPPAGPIAADKRSWLPGRVYNWTFLPGEAARSGPHPGRFNAADWEGFADGLLLELPGDPAILGDSQLRLALPEATQLEVRLLRASDDALLATYRSPEYAAVPTTAPFAANQSTSALGFLFRLAESYDFAATGTWLLEPDADPRSEVVPATALRAVPFGPNPAAYVNFDRVYEPDRLLNRNKTTGTSYNEDAPVFELPRGPLVSVGGLQHLPLPGTRPFAIGNPWGDTATLHGMPANAVFDRCFFSGLGPGTEVMPPDSAPMMPNLLLHALRTPDGRLPTLGELRARNDGMSSRHLLQAGVFNLNSVDSRAWMAVLRNVRFPVPGAFTYLSPSRTSGTAGDEQRVAWSGGQACFFRFPFSAQETFWAEPGLAETSVGNPSAANTHLFRRGLRVLSAVQLRALAEAIVARTRERHQLQGPFPGLEAFLAPSSIFAAAPPEEGGGPRSLLEAAIADAGLNREIPEFSSQWLTPADLMTALAPVLFARSDTFAVRGYGDVRHPETGAVQARSWCEAIVQRFPDYVDSSEDAGVPPADLTGALNREHGRQFRLISFRWLSALDL